MRCLPAKLCMVIFLTIICIVGAEVKGRRRLLGGFQPMNLSDQENSVLARNLAEFAAKKIDERSNHNFWHHVIHILSVGSQVVNGINYRITFYEGQTNCKKNMKQNKNLCSISNDENASFRKCTVMVYKPFESQNFKLNDNFQCENVARNQVFETSESRDDLGVDQSNTKKDTLKSYVVEKKQKNPDMQIFHDYDGNSSYDLSALNYLFKEFQKNYQKEYKTIEESQKRFENFAKNLEIILNLRKNERGTAKYGVTEFTDLTFDEFLAMHTGYRKSSTPKKARLEPEPWEDIDPEVDWRKQGAVTGVKNQGNCGSCWAFSTTGNIEGVWKIKKGHLTSLSEQQLVDCDKVDEGCNGGEMLDAYKEIERMGGLETESEYPYNARRKTCNFNKTEISVYINDSVSLPKDERQMAQYVAKNGPIAIGINAASMMFYFGGISHPWHFFCSPKHLNHGVLIVGYGQEKNKPYWIIKNSWGPHWGESGYYRIYRGDGSCGVDQDPSSVLVM